MIKRRIVSFLLVIILCCTLTSCWNYRELNNYKIISGMAIDYNDVTDLYTLNVELVNAMGEEQMIKSEVFTIQGNSVFQGVRDMIEKVGRKLYWSHAQVMVVSHQIAEKDIINVLDFIYRDAEMRTNMWILVSDDCSAADIYDTNIQDTSKIIAYHIDNILKSQDSISKYYSMEVWKFIKDLYAEGVSPTAPLVSVTDQNGKMTPVVSGTAVFNGSKMVGTLDSEETKYFILIRDDLDGGLILVEPEFKGEETLVALEVFDSKTKIKAEYKDEKIVMKINSSINVGIGETGYKVNLIDKPGRVVLAEQGEEAIKKRMSSVLSKVQRKYGTDIFGFAPIIERDIPKVWNEIKGDWENVFKKLDFEIEVDLNIRGSALINSPLEVRE